jgi:hypothetical protein
MTDSFRAQQLHRIANTFRPARFASVRDHVEAQVARFAENIRNRLAGPAASSPPIPKGRDILAGGNVPPNASLLAHAPRQIAEWRQRSISPEPRFSLPPLSLLDATASNTASTGCFFHSTTPAAKMIFRVLHVLRREPLHQSCGDQGVVARGLNQQADNPKRPRSRENSLYRIALCSTDCNPLVHFLAQSAPLFRELEQRLRTHRPFKVQVQLNLWQVER